MAARQIQSGEYLRRQQARLRLQQLDSEIAELLRSFPELGPGRGTRKPVERATRPVGPMRLRQRWLQS